MTDVVYWIHPKSRTLHADASCRFLVRVEPEPLVTNQTYRRTWERLWADWDATGVEGEHPTPLVEDRPDVTDLGIGCLACLQPRAVEQGWRHDQRPHRPSARRHA